VKKLLKEIKIFKKENNELKSRIDILELTCSKIKEISLDGQKIG
jgi:hypothetical protein